VKQRRANIFGLGLIGGSLAAALTARGWHVTGNDLHPDTEDEALRLGLVAARGIDADAELPLRFLRLPIKSGVLSKQHKGLLPMSAA
jgi:prephenate dehydrogenase